MRVLILFSLIISFSLGNDFQDYMSGLEQEVKKDKPGFKGFDYKRGEKIFTSKHIGKKGKEVSCTSCHGIDLTKEHKNLFTGKVIKPLSPKANPKRLTNVKDVRKWLRRNFKDVYNRVGTPQEKGDVLTYIMNK
ncbi:MAG: DUF1924 domain-containing protein [Campylobacterota bacterium]